MGNWKKEYEEIKVPENMKERMEASIARAKKDKRKVKNYGKHVQVQQRYWPLC